MPTAIAANKPEPVKEVGGAKAATPPTLPNHLRQKLTAKHIEVKDRVPVDFFGRRIQPKPACPVKEAAKKANEIISSDVWFKFKEGYNNAVRRTIRMKDMI